MRGKKHASELDRVMAVNTAKRAWEERNKGTLSAKKAAWYAANKDKIGLARKAARKRHYEKHRAHRIAYTRKRQGTIKNAYEGLPTAYQAEIQGIYDFCRMFKGFEVDHIVPLTHDLVCGMHVPWVKIHGQEMRLINDDSVEATVEDPRGVTRS